MFLVRFRLPSFRIVPCRSLWLLAWPHPTSSSLTRDSTLAAVLCTSLWWSVWSLLTVAVSHRSLDSLAFLKYVKILVVFSFTAVVCPWYYNYMYLLLSVLKWCTCSIVFMGQNQFGPPFKEIILFWKELSALASTCISLEHWAASCMRACQACCCNGMSYKLVSWACLPSSCRMCPFSRMKQNVSTVFPWLPRALGILASLNSPLSKPVSWSDKWCPSNRACSCHIFHQNHSLLVDYY